MYKFQKIDKNKKNTYSNFYFTKAPNQQDFKSGENHDTQQMYNTGFVFKNF